MGGSLNYVEHIVARENILTDRVKRIKDGIRKQPLYGDWERDHLYTEYWRKSEGEQIYIRRANAFDKVLSDRTIKIFDGELIVGSPSQYMVGAALYPEIQWKWIEEEWEGFGSREADQFIPSTNKEVVLKDIEFWKGKSLEDVAVPLWREQFGSLVEDMIEARLTYDYRPWTQGRQIVDFVKVLNKGLKGVIEEAEEMKKNTSLTNHDAYRKRCFWEGCIIACNAVIKFARRYGRLARTMSEKETDQARKEELEIIADICNRVPENPAGSFHEALQSLWFIHFCVEIENNSYGYSLGRMDQYFYPFYQRDIEEGGITKEGASELLACLLLKISTIYWLSSSSRVAFSQTTNYQNLTIGGSNKEGKDATNELSHLILEIDTALKLRQPTISLRYHDQVDENLLFKCGEDIATGGGKPAIFSENYAYRTLPLHGVPLEDVKEFAPIGCVEMGIPGKSVLFAGYFLSLPHCLELTFTSGIYRKTGKKIGINTPDVESLETFDQFMDTFFKQFEFVNHVNLIANGIAEVVVRPDRTPLVFNSALISDCIATGKDTYSGGGRYNQLYITNPVGMVTTANSLCAVKKLVYDDKVITMAELKDALAANFSDNGYDRVRKLCQDVPKYGNDMDEVDSIHRELFRRCIEIITKEKNALDAPVAAGFLGILAHHLHGCACGATPDGRPGYTPFADGSLSPYPGTDTHGPTAVIKSAAKANPSPALSTLFNMKLHPSVFEKPEGMRSFWNLVKTYSDLGGYHIQFNVVDRQTLLNAKARPEEYRDLLVRVAGFSAYFADLSPAVQDEIIARTEHVF